MANMANYKNMTIGDRMLEAGSSEKFHTGDWRSFAPIVDMEKCINCLTCWIYCPDESVLVEDGKLVGMKMSHCKGCGICAKVCPKKAITMKEE